MGLPNAEVLDGQHSRRCLDLTEAADDGAVGHDHVFGQA